MTYHAQVHLEDGSYWAEVRELPGCFAAGDSEGELREALAEAIGMCAPRREAFLISALNLLHRGPHVVLEGAISDDSRSLAAATTN